MEVNNDAVTVSTSYGSRSKAYGGSTTVGNPISLQQEDFKSHDICFSCASTGRMSVEEERLWGYC